MKQPPLAIRPLEHNVICDICGKPRQTRRHQRCSRLRQRLKQQERTDA